jgi:thioredoxin-like negative regulator of GroEL
LLKSDEPDLRDFRHFVVPSMLFRNANYHYRIGGHDQWLEAKKLLDLLIVLEPNNVRALSLLLKIHVRLRKFNDAESILAELKKLKAKERHFLEGFLLWKRRRFSAAVPHFETALQLGQEAVDIYHGLASCLFHLGKLDEAKKVVERGLRGKARDVVLLVDIAAQIAIARGDLEEAETYVEQLRRLKADADYHHRMATLLNARHRSTDALTHARAASEAPRARFENKTTLINTLIEVKNFSEAQRALDRLDEEYKFEEDRSDVRLGLRCKCLLRQEKWSQAEPIWEGLSDIGSPIHAALRKEMLKQKIADKKTTLAERNDANLQLAALVAAPGLESLLFADLVVAEYAAETNDE